jgi:DNA-binding protein HU-beta
MQKREFIEKLAMAMDCSKAEAGRSFQALFEQLSLLLQAGDDLMVPGFGRFTVTHKAARLGRNPQTGSEIKIAAKAVPVLRPAKRLKENVAKQVKPKQKVSKSL